MRKFRLPVIVGGVLLLALTGADGCPIALNPSQPAAGASSSSLDVGGSGGALWQLRFADQATMTLRLGSGENAATRVPLRAGPVDLLGATVDLGDLCWRTDLICPQGVLGEQIPILQPAAGAIVIGFNRRGPLASLQEAGLPGTIEGAELTVPLAVGQAALGSCALGSGSAVLATAYASDGKRAADLQGRVTVTYDGLCAGLGGAALPADSQLELSVGFTGQRL